MFANTRQQTAFTIHVGSRELAEVALAYQTPGVFLTESLGKLPYVFMCKLDIHTIRPSQESEKQRVKSPWAI